MFDKMKSHDVFRRELLDGAELVGMYDFPKIRTTQYMPHDLVPFNLAMTEKRPGNKWVHFFIDDYQFERLWNTPYKYLPILKRFEGVITPDYSMYLDMPVAQQIWNCYRNRVLAYWMQREGMQIMPSVGWSGKASRAWCFDGLASGSSVAISTNGCLATASARYYLKCGYAAMMEAIKPVAVHVYGRNAELPGYYYDSYSQIMKKRLKCGRTGSGGK